VLSVDMMHKEFEKQRKKKIENTEIQCESARKMKKREIDSTMNQEREKHKHNCLESRRKMKEFQSCGVKKQAQQSWQNPITGL